MSCLRLLLPSKAILRQGGVHPLKRSVVGLVYGGSCAGTWNFQVLKKLRCGVLPVYVVVVVCLFVLSSHVMSIFYLYL